MLYWDTGLTGDVCRSTLELPPCDWCLGFRVQGLGFIVFIEYHIDTSKGRTPFLGSRFVEEGSANSSFFGDVWFGSPSRVSGFRISMKCWRGSSAATLHEPQAENPEP